MAKDKSGRLFWVEVNIKWTAIGSEDRLLAIVRDITERKRSEEEHAQLANYMRLLLDSTDEGIYGIDLQARCMLVNRSGANMIGHRPEDLLGSNIHEAMHHSHPDGTPYPVDECPIVRAIRIGKGVRVDNEVFWRSDGSSFPVEYSSYPIVEGGTVKGAVVTFVDITDRKRAEEERARLAMERVKRAEAEAAREEITSIAAQLETTISAIPDAVLIHDPEGRQAQLLERMLKTGGQDGQQQHSIETIITSTRRMNAIIQDLVDSAWLQSGQLQLENQPLDVGVFVRDTLDRLKEALDTERVRVEIGSDLPRVVADPNRLERILTNLVSNALKYSPPRSEVLITARRTSTEMVVSVVDRGAGIPRVEQAHLFERFYRSGRTKRTEGMGLGLYISRMLVEAHGGRIWVESEPGKGVE